MATYEESITAVIGKMSQLYANKTKTEEQAVALASSKPSTVYLTTDTHAVVSGGLVYGRDAEEDARKALHDAVLSRVTEKTLSQIGGSGSQTKATIGANDLTVTSAANTNYVVAYSSGLIPKGTIIRFELRATTTRSFRYRYALSSPADYVTQHSTLVGFECDGSLLEVAPPVNTDYVAEAIMPVDGYIVFYYYNKDWTSRKIRYYISQMMQGYYGSNCKIWDYLADFLITYYGDDSSNNN